MTEKYFIVMNKESVGNLPITNLQKQSECEFRIPGCDLLFQSWFWRYNLHPWNSMHATDNSTVVLSLHWWRCHISSSLPFTSDHGKRAAFLQM